MARPVLPPARPLAGTRRHFLDVLASLGAVSLVPAACTSASGSASAPARAPRASSPARAPTGDVHDFDFLYGEWTSVNRRLKKRWVGSDDWDVFPGGIKCEPRLGGLVNVEDATFPTKGWGGMSIRVYDLAARQWSIYWISSRTGVLLPPQVGGFEGERGEFYGDDTDEGRPIQVRFVWTRLGPERARWEQAFSLDGTRWETNWTVEHTRVRS